MSVQAMSWVIENSLQTGSNFLCLLMMANHSHADGSNAFPSYETLARECRMSRRSIIRIVAKLVTAGDLRLDRPSRGRRPNSFTVVMHGTPATPPPPPPKPAAATRKPGKSTKKAEPDPRTAHVAIQTVREIAGRYPAHEWYDDIIRVIGDTPDVDKLRECFRVWRTEKKYSPMNFAWATDWYVKGTPGNGNGNGNGNGHLKPAQPGAPQPDREIVAYLPTRR